ncbi:MAG: hypothetical protein BroJett042_00580 [Bacteroidota bacterium]|nr:MAG: hypothetical protein BroJett042_00580 [Bacteroidota bacterium]
MRLPTALLLLSYDDGTTGFSLGFTHFGGSLSQNNWIFGYRYKAVSVKTSNDWLVGGDKWRTAALELGLFEYSLGFNVITNRASPITADNPPDLQYKSKAVGFNRNGKGTYSDGYRVASPLYLGFRYEGNTYRVGIDAPFVQDHTQNRWHKIIGSPYFKSGYGDQWRVYLFMRTYDPYSLY